MDLQSNSPGKSQIQLAIPLKFLFVFILQKFLQFNSTYLYYSGSVAGC